MRATVLPALIVALISLAPPRLPAVDGAALISGLPGRAGTWRPETHSRKLKGVPIRNFGVVAPGCLYRGAQPEGDGDHEWLVRQGFRGVVCLRKEHECGDRAEWLRKRGVAHLHLLVPDERAPTDEHAYRFLMFARNPDHWPVFVHCAQGRGRAGTMVALARYAMDGWPVERALREAGRFRPLGFPIFGDQKRWLNRWRDRFPAGQYHPEHRLAGPLPECVAVREASAQ